MTESARLVIAVDSRQVGQADRALNSLGRTSSAVMGAISGLGAAFGARELYQAAETYSTITNRMRLVTASAVELAAAQASVFAIAQKSGQSLSGTAELYQRIATNQNALKLSGQGVADVVETISKTMVISGTSAESANAALIQLGQAFASGTLRGEELNSVMEQAPALAQAIAAGMGKSVGELRSLGAAGKITAEAVVKALQDQADAVEETFGKMLPTIGKGLQQVGNSFTAFVGKLDAASGTSTMFSKALESVSTSMDAFTKDGEALSSTVHNVGAVMAGAGAAGAVLMAAKIGESAVAATRSVVAYYASRAANIAQAESAVQAARANQIAAQSAVVRAAREAAAARGTAVQTEMSIQLAQARMREAAATAATVAAQAGLRTASAGMLGVLGGPVGLAILAATAATSYFLFRDSTEEVKRSTTDLSAPLEQLTERWKKLGDAQRIALGNDLQLKVNESNQAIKDMAGEVETAFYKMGNAKGLPVESWIAPLKEFREAANSGGAGINDFAQALLDGQPAGSEFRTLVETVAGKMEQQRESAVKAAEGLKFLENQTRNNVNANNELSASGSTYLETLQKTLNSVQDNGSKVKEATRWLAEHKDATKKDKDEIMAKAIQIDKERAANKLNTSETKSATSALKEQQKALADFTSKAAITVKSSNSMADAYLAGADSVRELAIQQKIEEELLKTGAGARDAVTAAVNREADAKDRLDIDQSIASMRTETTNTLAQATATLQGADALETFNIQKSMSIALSGKKIDIGSKEYEQLLEQTKAQLAANKALEQAGKVEGIVDRLNPQIKLLKDFTAEQDALNAAIARYPENAALYQDALVKLGNEYEVNRSKATIWGQMTEGAIDRIDEAFATAWGNIGSGAESLWDNLKKGFKQTLGEIAHMLTTKPLLASISNWLTGTDNGQGVGSVWSKLLGGGGGGGASDSNGWGGMVSLGKNLYSAWSNLTGVGSSIASGYASGGISGALSGGVGYYGNMLSSLGSTLSSGFSSIVSSITGSAAASTAATTGATSALGGALSGAVAEGAASIGTNIGIAGATTAAASNGIGAAISSAMSSAAAMWPLAVIMGMYQSGKLYSAGVRPDASEMWDSAGSTALGKAAMLPQTVGAKYFEITDNILGKVVGGKMAAILSGSTLFQAVWSKVGSKLFGSGYKTKDVGIELGVDGGVFDAQQYVKQKKKGGLISGSSKTRYLHNPLDAETQDALGAAFNDKILNSMGLFSALGVKLSDSVLDGLNIATTRISTQGKTPEAIQEKLDAWIGSLGDSAVAAINAATNSGLQDYNFEALTTFVNNLYSVNAAVEKFGVKAVGFNVAGGKAVETLVAVSGGMEALTTGMNDYYAAFTTEMDRSADSLAAARAEFTKFGFTLPGTRDGLKDVVKGLDLTTEIGQNMFSAIVRNAKAAADAYMILEQRESAYRKAFFSEAENTALAIKGTTAELKAMGVTLPASRSEYRKMVEEAAKSTTDTGKAMYDTLMNAAGAASTVFDELDRRLNQGVTDSFSGVQRSISAQQKAATAAYNATNTSLSDMSATAVKSVTDLSSVSNSLESALKSLRGTSDDAVKTLRAQAQATLQSALATARAGGSLSGFTGLEDALETVSSNNTDLYGSMEDFARDQGRTANVVAELNGINGKQLTSAEATVKTLKDQIDLVKDQFDQQMAVYDQQLEFAQAQLDAINGTDNSIKSVVDAINAMNASVVAALGAISFPASSNTPQNNGSIVDTLYQSVLGRAADADGKAYWAGKLQSGELSYKQIAESLANGALAFDSGSYTGPVSQDALAASKAAAQKYLDSLKVPGFATGGDFGGGLRLVGENGPELEVTGPSRIYNANQTASMLRGGGDSGATAEEVRGLRRDIESNATYMAKLTKAVADGIDTLVNSGVQINGTVETKAVA